MSLPTSYQWLTLGLIACLGQFGCQGGGSSTIPPVGVLGSGEGYDGRYSALNPSVMVLCGDTQTCAEYQLDPADIELMTWPERDPIGQHTRLESSPPGEVFYIAPDIALGQRWYAIAWMPSTPPQGREYDRGSYFNGIRLADGRFLWRFYGVSFPELRTVSYNRENQQLAIRFTESLNRVEPAIALDNYVRVSQPGRTCAAVEPSGLLGQSIRVQCTPLLDLDAPIRLEILEGLQSGVPMPPLDLTITLSPWNERYPDSRYYEHPSALIPPPVPADWCIDPMAPTCELSSEP